MAQLQQIFDPRPSRERRGLLVDLGLLGAEGVIGVLGLVAIDSIYHLPMAVRGVLVGAGAAGIIIALLRVVRGRRGVDRGRLVHRGLVGGMLLAFFLGAVLVRPGFFERELTRVFTPWRNHSPDSGRGPDDESWQGPIQGAAAIADNSSHAPLELKVEPGSTQLQRGDTLRVVVGVNRDAGPVLLRRRGPDGQWHTRPMNEDPAEPGRFSDLLRDVCDDVAYQAVVGPVASPVYQVRVYDVASLKEIRLSYSYPSDTGLPDRTVISADGNIEAVAGTRVQITLVATGPLRRSSMQVNGEQPLPMEVRGPEARRTLEVVGDGEYALTALDSNGTPLDLPDRFGIHALPPAAAKAEAVHSTENSMIQPME